MDKEITLTQMSVFVVFVGLLTLAGVAIIRFSRSSTDPPSNTAPPAPTNHMQLLSSAFGEGQAIPKVYTCNGDNISPPLQISRVPDLAVSLVLILHDPDAPVAGGFTHWVVFNMDPVAAMIAENSKPSSGIEATNGAGKIGYTGPCPPSGIHHYEFRLYALDEKIPLDATATKADVEKAMDGHIIKQTVLTAQYKHQ